MYLKVCLMIKRIICNPSLDLLKAIFRYQATEWKQEEKNCFFTQITGNFTFCQKRPLLVVLAN